jgi:hypothetical protein
MRLSIYFLVILILIIIIFPQNGLSYGNSSPSNTDFIDSYLKNLDDGKIYFNPTKEMKVGIAENIILKLTRENLSDGEKIKLGKYMTATLVGKSFTIDPITHEEQVVASEGFTMWEWCVTPQDDGNQTLELLVSVRLKIPNDGEEVKDMPVYRKHILVRVNPAYSIINYFSNNQNWIIPLILGSGILGLLYKKSKTVKALIQKYFQ